MSDFDELFSLNKRFRVPVYQRNYDWTIANTKRLFDDIETLVANPYMTHFMGAVCYKKFGQCYYDLVDGQQRITSVMLLLRAMAECMDDDDKEELMNDLRVKRNFPIRSESGALKLSLNKTDDDVLRKFFFVPADVAERTLSDFERSLPIWVNYQYLLTRFRKLRDEGVNISEYALALSRLTFAKLMVESENPQEIFESLNSTGLDLSNVDLLRNAFLMPFPYDIQEHLYEAYWHPMESLFDSRSQMIDFFVDYLILRNKSNSFIRNGRVRTISKNSLYDAFREYHARVMDSDTELMFDDMLDVARLYSETLFSDNFNLLTTNAPKWRQWVYVGGLIVKHRYNRAVLLHVLENYAQNHISDIELLECVRLLMTLLVRGRMCGRPLFTAQSSGNVLSRLSRNKDKSLSNALKHAFIVGKGSYAVPVDAEVREVLTQMPVYETGLQAQGVKALLYSLEWNRQNNKGLPSFDDESLSVEHIMPQKLTEEWVNSLTDSSKEHHAIRLHMLGNLALTNHNSEMSNKSFAEKRRHYNQSHYAYTRMLGGKTAWQDVDISQRGQQLCKAVLDLWHLPSTMQQGVVPVVGNVRLVDAADDVSLVTSKKLLGIYVGDKSLTVTSWNSMVPAMVNVLDEIDHDALIKCVKQGVSDTFAVRGDKVAIVRDGKSAGSYVRSVANLMSTFDDEAGTEFYSTVGFECVTRKQKDFNKKASQKPHGSRSTGKHPNAKTQTSQSLSNASELASKIDVNSNTSIKYPQVGSRVRHKKFGYGDVLRVDRDKVKVQFQYDREPKMLILDTVNKGILEVL